MHGGFLGGDASALPFLTGLIVACAQVDPLHQTARFRSGKGAQEPRRVLPLSLRNHLGTVVLSAFYGSAS